MRSIAELNVFLRAQIELPAGLKLATEEFHEGWSVMRTGGAKRLRKRIETRGWKFISIAEGSLRSGVGETSKAAIASALKLALRRVSTYFNAVEVEHIELTQYPWFFLARLSVLPYRIQEEAVAPAPDESLEMAPRQRRLSPQADLLFPQFGSAMPQLKELLVSSRNLDRNLEVRPQ